ncbi:MAG: hypothetical protein IT328_20750 [Caldilineaceae bacterium]|nr:hypothetical protein [Caldilineaceae bacterium]
MSYTGHSFYRLLAALCVILILLFAWQLRARWDWGALLFMAIAAWSAFRCVRLMLSQVEVMDDRVRLVAPGSSPREVEFRQLSEVHEEGRGLKSILLVYYPRMATGLLDLDEERTLLLPAVNGHAELLAALAAKVPS